MPTPNRQAPFRLVDARFSLHRAGGDRVQEFVEAGEEPLIVIEFTAPAILFGLGRHKDQRRGWYAGATDEEDLHVALAPDFSIFVNEAGLDGEFTFPDAQRAHDFAEQDRDPERIIEALDSIRTAIEASSVDSLHSNL